MLSTTRIRSHASGDPSAPPDAAVIFLHGLGADADDFRSIANALGPFGRTSVEYVLPQAPEMPVTVNAGIKMPAWFDILTMTGERQDAEGIHRAGGEIEEIVAELHGRGVARRNVFLGGFSQGGAVALHCAARSPQPFGGAVALSSYLPLITDYPQAVTDAGRDTPVFMTHGANDDIIPIKYMRASRRALEAAKVTVAWREYPLGHSINEQVIADLSDWLARRLGGGQSAEDR